MFAPGLAVLGTLLLGVVFCRLTVLHALENCVVALAVALVIVTTAVVVAG